MKVSIIAFVSAKGGVGKSTSAAYSAMCFHAAGEAVTGVDADPEKSWLKWQKTGALSYTVVEANRDDLAGQTQKLKGHIIIDTPPNDINIIYEAAEVATHVVIPLGVSGMDISRLATTLKPVLRVQRDRDMKVSVLLTEYRSNLNISRQGLDMLQKQRVPVLASKIRDLARYKSFSTPSYLEEYEAVLKEMGVLGAEEAG